MATQPATRNKKMKQWWIGLGVFLSIASGCANQQACPCESDTLSVCDESESFESDTGLDSETEPTLPFVPTNVGDISLAGITGDLLFDGKVCNSARLNTEDGTASCTSDTGYTYQEIEQPDGSRIGVFAAQNIRLESTEELALNGTIPIVMIALQDVLIAGTIYGGPGIVEGVAGGYSSTTALDAVPDGKGPGGAIAYNDHLGGGGSFCGIGGTEGNGTGVGGDVYGNQLISPLMGGSGGAAYFSGGGGGALQISAGGTIRIAPNGVITMPGGGKQGGGGSGGAILLEAKDIIVEGVLAANGGGGDGKGGTTPEYGQPNNNPASGGINTEAPGYEGGMGSAGDAVNGQNGNCAEMPCDFGGSGGGGAGRIRLNSSSGAAQVTGIVSPSLLTQCATQGIIVPAE